MKKTVIFEFDDDNEFPDTFSVRPGIESNNLCCSCPFVVSDGIGDVHCFLTGDGDYPLSPSTVPCPLKHNDIINYDEIN